MFNLAFSQGRLSGALGGVKDKLKKIEKEIKDNAALLSINTPSNFDGYRFDMNKVFNIQKIKENTFQSMTKNQNRSFSILQISVSIILAALILICSILLKDSDKNQMVINVLIIGAALQISLIGFFANKLLKKKNIAC